MLWPGDKYPEEDIHDLFKYSMEYVKKHPKTSLAQLHGYLVALLGACSYHHAAAIWPLLKTACGFGFEKNTSFHSVSHFQPKKTLY